MKATQQMIKAMEYIYISYFPVFPGKYRYFPPSWEILLFPGYLTTLMPILTKLRHSLNTCSHCIDLIIQWITIVYDKYCLSDIHVFKLSIRVHSRRQPISAFDQLSRLNVWLCPQIAGVKDFTKSYINIYDVRFTLNTMYNT